jgi:hypothetical protein
VQLQLMSLDESLPSDGQVFVPTLSVAVNGASTSAPAGEKFTILGEFTTHSTTEEGQLNYETTIMSAANFAEGASYPSTIEQMRAASKKGVDFFVVILTWQPITKINQKVGSEAEGI